jgi:hypothetical protein
MWEQRYGSTTSKVFDIGLLLTSETKWKGQSGLTAREDDVDKQESENGRPVSASCETQVRYML